MAAVYIKFSFSGRVKHYQVSLKNPAAALINNVALLRETLNDLLDY